MNLSTPYSFSFLWAALHCYPLPFSHSFWADHFMPGPLSSNSKYAICSSLSGSDCGSHCWKNFRLLHLHFLSSYQNLCPCLSATMDEPSIFVSKDNPSLNPILPQLHKAIAPELLLTLSYITIYILFSELFLLVYIYSLILIFSHFDKTLLPWPHWWRRSVLIIDVSGPSTQRLPHFLDPFVVKTLLTVYDFTQCRWFLHSWSLLILI